eukprot:gene2221-33781_t
MFAIAAVVLVALVAELHFAKLDLLVADLGIRVFNRFGTHPALKHSRNKAYQAGYISLSTTGLTFTRYLQAAEATSHERCLTVHASPKPSEGDIIYIDCTKQPPATWDHYSCKLTITLESELEKKITIHDQQTKVETTQGMVVIHTSDVLTEINESKVEKITQVCDLQEVSCVCGSMTVRVVTEKHSTTKAYLKSQQEFVVKQVTTTIHMTDTLTGEWAEESNTVEENTHPLGLEAKGEDAVGLEGLGLHALGMDDLLKKAQGVELRV